MAANSYHHILSRKKNKKNQKTQQILVLVLFQKTQMNKIQLLKQTARSLPMVSQPQSRHLPAECARSPRGSTWKIRSKLHSCLCELELFWCKGDTHISQGIHWIPTEHQTCRVTGLRHTGSSWDQQWSMDLIKGK